MIRLCVWLVFLCLWLGTAVTSKGGEDVASRCFDQGLAAAKAGDSARAFEFFSQSAAARPASGTLHDLGNAAWRIGRPGPAVLAWEQAVDRKSVV